MALIEKPGQEEFSHITERLGPGTLSWAAESGQHLARYFHAVESAKGKRVLDAGTGLGYGAMLLKHFGAREVVGVDIDEDSVARAREKYGREGLGYLVDDCETLANVRGPFDVVCNFENIEHVPHPERVLASIARVMADDGVLFCSTPDRATSVWIDGRPRNKYHVNEWYRDEFAGLLSGSFSDVVLKTQVMSTSLIAHHQGLDGLLKHLHILWESPAVRLTRGVGRLFGKAPEWPSVLELRGRSWTDFPIVDHELVDIYGESSCHFAICRGPRR